jgi:diamine N-acetyltransferase
MRLLDSHCPSVRLRPTTVADLARVLEAERASIFVRHWSSERHQEVMAARDSAHLIVEAIPGARAVGFLILLGVGSSDAVVCLQRIVIWEEGRGYGRAALREVKRMTFDELGAHRLWLDVAEDNTRAQRLYASEGFCIEGILREAFKRGDHFVSLVVMSVLEHEHGAAA